MKQFDAPPDALPDTLLTTLSSYHHVEMGDARSLPLDAYTSQDLFDAEIERAPLVYFYRYLANQLVTASDWTGSIES